MAPTPRRTHTTQMVTSSRETAAQGRWNTAQLLDVVNHPLGPEWTLNELKDFASSKNYVEIVRGLDREDAAKLVDFFDQVRRPGFRDALVHLTTIVMTRPSHPSIGGTLKTRRC